MPRNQPTARKSSITRHAARQAVHPVRAQAGLDSAGSTAEAPIHHLTALTPLEASRLQRTIGNRALGRLLSPEQPVTSTLPDTQSTIQRAPLVARPPARQYVGKGVSATTQDTFFRAPSGNTTRAPRIQRTANSDVPVIQRQLNLAHGWDEMRSWNDEAQALIKDFNTYLGRLTSLSQNYRALIKESFYQRFKAAKLARKTWDNTDDKISIADRAKVRGDLDISLKVLDQLEREVPARQIQKQQEEQDKLDAQRLKDQQEQQQREAKEQADREQQERIRQEQENEKREQDEKTKQLKIEEVNKSLMDSRQYCSKRFKNGMPANLDKWYAAQEKTASSLPGLSLEQVKSFAQALKDTGKPMVVSWQGYWKLQSDIPAHLQAECLAHLDTLSNDARSEHTEFLAGHKSHIELAYTALKGAHDVDPASAIATAKQEMATNAAYKFDSALRTSVESRTSAAVDAASQIKIDALEVDFDNAKQKTEPVKGTPSQKQRIRDRNELKNLENAKLRGPYDARIETIQQEMPAQVEALRALIRDFIKANPALKPADAKMLAEWAISYAGADANKLTQALAAYTISAAQSSPAEFMVLTNLAASPEDVPWALGVAQGDQALATSLLQLLGNTGAQGKKELKALADLMPEVARTINVDLAGLNQQQLVATCNNLAEGLPGKRNKDEGGKLAGEMITSLRCNGAGLTPLQLHDLALAMVGYDDVMRHCKKLAGVKDSLNQFFPTLISLLVANKGWQMDGVVSAIRASFDRRNDAEMGAFCELLSLANLHTFQSNRIVNAMNTPDNNDLDDLVVVAKRFIAQGNKGNEAQKPDGETAGGEVASHDFAVTTPATIDDPEFDTEYEIVIYGSRLNHFVNGHTYKHFEFTLANINRGLEPQNSTLYTVKATSADDVLNHAEQVIATQAAENLAARTATDVVGGRRQGSAGGYVIGFKRLDDIGTTKALELVQFYPRAGDTLRRSIAIAIGRLFGTITP